jgi:hypothetical protein
MNKNKIKNDPKTNPSSVQPLANYIKQVLPDLLKYVELEYKGKVIKVDGFSLKELIKKELS